MSPAATGSKSHSAAIWERNGDGSKKLIRRVAVRPAVMVFQNRSRVAPPGATTPTPVTTVRAAGHDGSRRAVSGRRLGVDVAEFRAGRERAEVEDHLGRLVAGVAQPVPDVRRHEERLPGGQRHRLVVEVDGDRAPGDVEELLAVRVVVLGDPLAGRERGDPHEAGGAADGLRAEQHPQLAAAPPVGGDVAGATTPGG